MILKYKIIVLYNMFLCVNETNYESNNIIFSQKIKNNIIANGYFHKMYYSDRYFTSNGLLFLFSLKDVSVENYFNRIKCTFCKKKNKDILLTIRKLEHKILSNFNNKYLRSIYRIEEQLRNEYIKIFSDKKFQRGKVDKLEILLKISGIWSNDRECGITFRFLVNHSN
jgi:hypothetical protein